ncbi:MAG: hypothetical protein K0S56_1352 [Microvirga sp.]|nr:hypothetical protein [Microvirga sp.]
MISRAIPLLSDVAQTHHRGKKQGIRDPDLADSRHKVNDIRVRGAKGPHQLLGSVVKKES